MMSSRVVAEGVSAILGGEVALNPISFAADAGEALSIVGPNGAGKTTLLNLIAGNLAPATGKLRVNGAAPNEKDPKFRAQVAALIAAPPFAHNLTLAEHLSLVGVSWGRSAEEGRLRGIEILDAFGVANLAQRFPHELSSGQAQMFTLALILVRPCEILLLDEPEQRLDVDRVGILAQLLRTVCESGVTVVMSSHNAALVDGIGAGLVDLGKEPSLP
jgi:ABC-type multidrug transport system ATPase subunit